MPLRFVPLVELRGIDFRHLLQLALDELNLPLGGYRSNRLPTLAFCQLLGEKRGMQGKQGRDRQLLDALRFAGAWSKRAPSTSSWPTTAPSCSGTRTSPTCSPRAGACPSVPAVVVASVKVLESLEGLSERDAMSALRTRIVLDAAREAVARTGVLADK